MQPLQDVALVSLGSRLAITKTPDVRISPLGTRARTPNISSSVSLQTARSRASGNPVGRPQHSWVHACAGTSGEYQLTRVLKTLQEKGTKFYPGEVEKWLDCGNKQATVETHKAYLGFIKENNLISKTAKIVNSVIIPPVYLGDNVEINNTVIGPYVSVGENSKIGESRIQNSIIQKENEIRNANLANSMLGNFVTFEGKSTDLSVGDFNTIYN